MTAKDALNYTVVNNTSSNIQLAADGGASFGSNLLILTANGTTKTTIINDKVGTVNVTATLVGTAIVSTKQIIFKQSDVIAPVMISHTPTNGATNVQITVVPVITFFKALNPITVNSTNIQLRKFANDEQVSAIVSPAEGNTMVLITPSSALQNNTQYYLAVSNAVTDMVGNSLANPFGVGEKAAHEFTTIAVQPIVIDKLEQVNNSPIANGSYLAGWRHAFEITVNTNETNLFVKADDWVNSANSDLKVLANGNMRLLFNSSTGNGLGSIVGLTDTDIVAGVSPIKSYEIGNNYTDQKLNGVPTAININGLDISTNPGRQIKFDVFTKIPAGTTAGFYDTKFDIKVE